MAKISRIAFTPDGRQLVSASDDETIRVWDLASGKTVRTIRGESAPGTRARSTPWRCRRTANGWRRGDCCSPETTRWAIRLYEFASGKLVALLKGHADVVIASPFRPMAAG